MVRITLVVSLLSVLAGCATGGTQKVHPRMLLSDIEKNPQLRFRIDSFSIPEAARAPFDAAMKRNYEFIQTLPGYQGHFVFEKTGGPGTFNLVTVAVWESQEAIDKAVAEVQAYYQRIGFSPAALVAQYGIKAELGQFSAVPMKE